MAGCPRLGLWACSIQEKLKILVPFVELLLLGPSALWPGLWEQVSPGEVVWGGESAEALLP